MDANLEADHAGEFLAAVKEVATLAARGEIATLAKQDHPKGDDVLSELRRPFAPAAVKWKIQVEHNNAVTVVAHLDARLVIERLNAVVGLGWHDAYRPMSNSWMWCDLTVLGETRTDCGTGADGKAQVSDSFKRAGVKWNIGVSIYAMAAVFLKRGDEPNEVRYRKKKKGQQEIQVPLLDKRTLDWLAGAYERWITEGAGKRFGEPLDHGDQAGAMGLEDPEPEVEEPAEDAPEVVQLEGEQADAARERARKAFDVLRERGEMLPGIFNRGLTAAGGSIEELEAFAGELEAQAAKEPEA